MFPWHGRVNSQKACPKILPQYLETSLHMFPVKGLKIHARAFLAWQTSELEENPEAYSRCGFKKQAVGIR
jgi:hypothetical protein